MIWKAIWAKQRWDNVIESDKKRRTTKEVIDRRNALYDEKLSLEKRNVDTVRHDSCIDMLDWVLGAK